MGRGGQRWAEVGRGGQRWACVGRNRPPAVNVCGFIYTSKSGLVTLSHQEQECRKHKHLRRHSLPHHRHTNSFVSMYKGILEGTVSQDFSLLDYITTGTAGGVARWGRRGRRCWWDLTS